MSAGLLVAVVLAQPGLCGPVKPESTPDASVAAPYAEVAEAEQAAGNREIALVAWREVLRWEPDNARARAAVKALCRESSSSGGPRGEAEVPGEEEAVEALQEGLARFERGEDVEAAAAFHEALAAPELADTASFFLGLIALREGRGREAGAFFEAAAASEDEALARRAEELRLRAVKQGRVALQVWVGGEYDSNVDLTPDGTLRREGSADAVGTVLAELRLRPWGQRGGYARFSGHYRGHQQRWAFDLAGVGGALGWAHVGTARRLSAEYGFDLLSLGGLPYLRAHRLQVEGGVSVGPVVLEASWALRREDFLRVDFSGYSGWRNTVRLEAEWSPVEAVTVSAGWLGGYLRANDVALGHVEHGPRAGLRVRLRPGLHLLGEAGYTLRDYEAFDEPLGTKRKDGYLDASAALEWDVAPNWSFQATVGWRGASSNVPELSYGRLAGGLALVWAGGLL